MAPLNLMDLNLETEARGIKLFEFHLLKLLSIFRNLVVDARYEKVRTGAGVVSKAVMIFVGIAACGHREILSIRI